MSSISFTKFQGAGNDFILIDDRDGRFPVSDQALIRKVCHRHFGIGADGVVLLGSCSSLAANFQMRIFNSDGCEASSCGNGLRCFVRFLQELGIVQKTYTIQTQERVVAAYLANGLPVIDMGVPENLNFEVLTEAGMVHCIDTGVPHAVQFVPDVDKVDLYATGGFLRRHFQANVDFASFEEDRSIRVRTFERGIEGETLSCGTGAAAVAAVAFRVYGLKGPIPICFRGGRLEVWDEEGRMFLAGPAERVFTGTFSLNQQ